MKLYLWDNAAIEFCQKFRAFESPPSVVLVTTVNPKRLGGEHLHMHFILICIFDPHVVCSSTISITYAYWVFFLCVLP